MRPRVHRVPLRPAAGGMVRGVRDRLQRAAEWPDRAGPVPGAPRRVPPSRRRTGPGIRTPRWWCQDDRATVAPARCRRGLGVHLLLLRKRPACRGPGVVEHVRWVLGVMPLLIHD